MSLRGYVYTSGSPFPPASHQSIYLLSTEVTIQLRPEKFGFAFTSLSNLRSKACRSDLLQASAVTDKLGGFRILAHKQSYLNWGHRIQHVKTVKRSHMVNPHCWAEQLSARSMWHMLPLQPAPVLELRTTLQCSQAPSLQRDFMQVLLILYLVFHSKTASTSKSFYM